MGKSLAKILATAAVLALTAGGVHAKETVIWWDFLGGGDGIRMKKLIADFNAEHKDTIEIQGTTLDWGVPFYTKVQTSAAVGEGPDIMTYHASRIPLAIDQGTLTEITADDLKTIGLGEADFAPATWAAAHGADGKLYALPFDTHPIVLYYNKTLLEKAGLIGDNGLPKDLNGIDNFTAAMEKVKAAGAKWGLSTYNSNGDFAYRTIYSLFGQQDGVALSDKGEWFAGDNADKLAKALQVVSDWVKNKVSPPYTDYPSTVALFTSGQAAFMINGVWEVPTMNDLADQKKLGFEWGAIELPVFFGHPSTYEDSHTFAIPNNIGKPQTPEKHAAVLEIMKWMEAHALFWATAGHIPANQHVTDSAEYKAMQPQATYAVLTKNGLFDPKSKYAGVAGAVFEAAANHFTAAVNNETDAASAVKAMKEELDALD